MNFLKLKIGILMVFSLAVFLLFSSLVATKVSAETAGHQCGIAPGQCSYNGLAYPVKTVTGIDGGQTWNCGFGTVTTCASEGIYSVNKASDSGVATSGNTASVVKGDEVSAVEGLCGRFNGRAMEDNNDFYSGDAPNKAGDSTGNWCGEQSYIVSFNQHPLHSGWPELVQKKIIDGHNSYTKIFPVSMPWDGDTKTGYAGPYEADKLSWRWKCCARVDGQTKCEDCFAQRIPSVTCGEFFTIGNDWPPKTEAEKAAFLLKYGNSSGLCAKGKATDLKIVDGEGGMRLSWKCSDKDSSYEEAVDCGWGSPATGGENDEENPCAKPGLEIKESGGNISIVGDPCVGDQYEKSSESIQVKYEYEEDPATWTFPTESTPGMISFPIRKIKTVKVCGVAWSCRSKITGKIYKCQSGSCDEAQPKSIVQHYNNSGTLVQSSSSVSASTTASTSGFVANQQATVNNKNRNFMNTLLLIADGNGEVVYNYSPNNSTYSSFHLKNYQDVVSFEKLYPGTDFDKDGHKNELPGYNPFSNSNIPVNGNFQIIAKTARGISRANYCAMFTCVNGQPSAQQPGGSQLVDPSGVVIDSGIYPNDPSDPNDDLTGFTDPNSLSKCKCGTLSKKLTKEEAAQLTETEKAKLCGEGGSFKSGLLSRYREKIREEMIKDEQSRGSGRYDFAAKDYNDPSNAGLFAWTWTCSCPPIFVGEQPRTLNCSGGEYGGKAKCGSLSGRSISSLTLMERLYLLTILQNAKWNEEDATKSIEAIEKGNELSPNGFTLCNPGEVFNAVYDPNTKKFTWKCATSDGEVGPCEFDTTGWEEITGASSSIVANPIGTSVGTISLQNKDYINKSLMIVDGELKGSVFATFADNLEIGSKFYVYEIVAYDGLEPLIGENGRWAGDDSDDDGFTNKQEYLSGFSYLSPLTIKVDSNTSWHFANHGAFSITMSDVCRHVPCDEDGKPILSGKCGNKVCSSITTESDYPYSGKNSTSIDLIASDLYQCTMQNCGGKTCSVEQYCSEGNPCYCATQNTPTNPWTTSSNPLTIISSGGISLDGNTSGCNSSSGSCSGTGTCAGDPVGTTRVCAVKNGTCAVWCPETTSGANLNPWTASGCFGSYACGI